MPRDEKLRLWLDYAGGAGPEAVVQLMRALEDGDPSIQLVHWLAANVPIKLLMAAGYSPVRLMKFAVFPAQIIEALGGTLSDEAPEGLQILRLYCELRMPQLPLGDIFTLLGFDRSGEKLEPDNYE